MGYFDKGVFILDNTLRNWAHGYGVRSMLRTPKIKPTTSTFKPIKNYKPIEMFSTEEEATQYIKDYSMPSILRPISEQFESGGVQEGCKVWLAPNGNKKILDFGKTSILSPQNIEAHRKSPRTLRVFHTHPEIQEGKSTPISAGQFRDLGLLARLNLKSITAWSTNGQFSQIEVLPNTSHKTLGAACMDSFDYIKSESLADKGDRFNLLKYLNTTAKKCGWNLSKTNEKELNKLSVERNKAWEEKEDDIKFLAKATHNFYARYADRYGMKYTTNMTF